MPAHSRKRNSLSAKEASPVVVGLTIAEAVRTAVPEVSPHLSLQNPHVGRNQAVCAHRLCNTGGYLDHRGQADARSPSIAP
ncbi:MAG: hypothetical protein U1A22_01640, partial [Xanthomonadaceae bacterium]|nr:hypothetical protein [Xanthomonadaceae bacterium]